MAAKILIVDDSPVFRRSLKSALASRNDWEIVAEAIDGLEGVEHARKHVPHLIIMDLIMPRLTGLEAATQILAEFPDMPILLLTLYLTRELENVAKSIGIKATLSKMSMHGFLECVELLLRSGIGPTSPTVH